MAEKIQLTKKDRLSVAWRHQFLQGSWNYEMVVGVIQLSQLSKNYTKIHKIEQML